MISKEEVQHIANLARIALTPEEIEKFQKDLTDILAYFDILKSANTEDMEPMTHSVVLENVARDDEFSREKPEVIEKLVTMAPSVQKGFIKVKEVFETK